ncbi:MAG: trigger factor [Rhodobiaceae bacterium]|nr:trigger factor [Rhodobiaceae bacterium]MCC0056950.1 trigger factor [Rhodobiaceae bacterium]
MQVSETLNEGLKRELKITIPAGELDRRLNGRLAELKDRVRIPGFRPGKVPVAHLKRVYGRSVMAEVIQESVDEASRQALEERKEKPALQPQISFSEDEKEVESVISGKTDLAYSMAFEVLPEFEVKDLSGLKLEKLAAEVSDREIDESLEQISKQNRPFNPKEGAAAEGDRLVFDYLGKIDGVPFEGGADTDSQIVIGSNAFIPGFEDQLAGMKAGEEKTITVTFPDPYQAAHLAGREATFDVAVKEVAAPGEAAIDDELATKLGLDSLEALKTAIRDQISKEFENHARERLKRQLLDALDEAYNFDLPGTLVEQEFEQIWTQATGEMERAGRSFADEDTTEEEAREEYRKIAVRRVRLGLLLSKIGEDGEVQVTDEETNKAMIETLRQYPGQEQQVWEFYQKNPQAVASLRAPLFENKVVDYIVSKADVTEKTVSREELYHDLHDHDHDHDHDHHHDHHHGHDHHHDHDHDHDHGEKAKPKKKAAPKKAAKKAGDE